MNASEKKVLFLALFLLGTGWLVRFSPWNPVPSIESFSYEMDSPAVEMQKDSGAVLEPVSKGGPYPEKFHLKKKVKKVHFPIAINRASAEDLCAIKGVGPKLAERIVAHRERVGVFKNAEDLRKVSGIGEKKSKSIIPFVIFD
jgi:competence protein ComEA